MLWLPEATAEMRTQVRASLPHPRIAAAVLVPLIERSGGFTVLLTQRAANLRNHAGQISFPGGRIEVLDADAWHAALREAREEIGLAPQLVEFAGYLPDHLIMTGYRVTPVVGFVSADYQLRLDAAEVHDAFEAPLEFLFDSENHRPRLRALGDASLTVYDITFGTHTIWGATALMLMTLRRLIHEHERLPEAP